MYICYIYIYLLLYYIIYIFINSYIQSLYIKNAIIYNPSIYIYMYILFHHAAMRLEESEHQELLRSERVLSALRQAQQSLQKRQERLKLVVGLMG